MYNNPSCKVSFEDLMFIMSSCRNTFAKVIPKRLISYIKVNISFETIVNLTKHNQYILLILSAALVIQMKLQRCYENENFEVMQSTYAKFAVLRLDFFCTHKLLMTIFHLLDKI